jgi:hypothetical protein
MDWERDDGFGYERTARGVAYWEQEGQGITDTGKTRQHLKEEI